MKRLCVFFFAVLATVTLAMAQQSTRTIHGYVVTAPENEPVIGATVKVEGTNLNGVTDAEGRFRISGVPSTAKSVQVTYVGMTSQQVAITGGEIKVVLALNAENLGEVVVTAMGIKREKRALGYASQELKAENLNTDGTTSMASAIQ